MGQERRKDGAEKSSPAPSQLWPSPSRALLPSKAGVPTVNPPSYWREPLPRACCSLNQTEEQQRSTQYKKSRAAGEGRIIRKLEGAGSL